MKSVINVKKIVFIFSALTAFGRVQNANAGAAVVIISTGGGAANVVFGATVAFCSLRLGYRAVEMGISDIKESRDLEATENNKAISDLASALDKTGQSSAPKPKRGKTLHGGGLVYAAAVVLFSIFLIDDSGELQKVTSQDMDKYLAENFYTPEVRHEVITFLNWTSQLEEELVAFNKNELLNLSTEAKYIFIQKRISEISPFDLSEDAVRALTDLLGV